MKILVIRYRFIGDTVLTVPFLRNLRKAYPDAVIDMLAGPVSGDVLLECPYLDNLIYFDTTRKHKYENKTDKKKGFWSYVKLLRQAKYDKAYVLKRSFSSAALAFMAGIKERVGFDTENRGFLLTKKVPYEKNKHEVECFLDVLRADGVSVFDNYLENWVSPDSDAKINAMIANHETLKIMIHATSGNINKQWPLEYFAQVIEHLVNKKHAQIYFTGTEQDFATYDEILKLIKSDLKIKPANFCGKLSIQDSTALISRMNFLIGSDSGALHLAASLNIPVIGIYGPMNPIKWQSWGEIHRSLYLDMPCIPCDLKTKCDKDFACLKNITPELVIQEADRLFAENDS